MPNEIATSQASNTTRSQLLLPVAATTLECSFSNLIKNSKYLGEERHNIYSLSTILSFLSFSLAIASFGSSSSVIFSSLQASTSSEPVMHTQGSSSSSVDKSFASRPSPVIVSRLSPVIALIFTPARIPYRMTWGTSGLRIGLSPIRPTSISSQPSKLSALRNFLRSNLLELIQGLVFFLEFS